jgi:hypothetical protein
VSDSLGWYAEPLEMGGLGVLDLMLFGSALRLLWLWLRHANPSQVWAFLPCNEDPMTTTCFRPCLFVLLLLSFWKS